MADNPRIEELRRRVQKDPSSIAFAQLAEEYRRAGNFAEAIATCRTGLSRHPGYLSARVTLGRALIETGELDGGEAELNHVLNAAPENLAAIRGLADIHQRRGNLAKALTFYRRALALARHDPDLEQTVSDIERMMGSVPPPVEVPGGLSFAQVQEELLSLAPPPASTPSQPVFGSKEPEPDPEPEPEPEAQADPGIATAAPDAAIGFDPTAASADRIPHNPEWRHLPALEAFLDAIAAYRQRSGPSS